MNLIYGVIGTYALSNCSGSSLAKKQFFRKPTRPSLPLRKAPPLISVFFNGLYTPFGSPVSGGQKPQGRRGKPPSVLLFLKSPRPSLPLKRAPPLTPTLSPSGKREETAPPRRSEPLRSKVGGASKPSPDVVRDGTALLQLASGLRHVVRDGTAWEQQFIVYS